MFDELALDTDGIRLVKVDVEGAERYVLGGMRQFLLNRRPVVICEVLDADSKADITMLADRNRQLHALLADVQYVVFWLRKGGGRVQGLESVSAFRQRVFDDYSRDNCDYLFVPAELEDVIGREFGISNRNASEHSRDYEFF